MQYTFLYLLIIYIYIYIYIQTIIYKQHFIKNQPIDSQSLHVKGIYSTNSEFDAHIDTIKDQFVKLGYEKTLVDSSFEKVEKLDRSVHLAEQNKSKKASRLPLSVAYNRALPPVENRPKIRGHVSDTSIS